MRKCVHARNSRITVTHNTQPEVGGLGWWGQIEYLQFLIYPELVYRVSKMTRVRGAAIPR